MERQNDGEPDRKGARNVDSALIHNGNPLESPAFCASPAFFRSLLEDLIAARLQEVNTRFTHSANADRLGFDLVNLETGELTEGAVS